jgi:hypothetical protein
MREKAFKLLDTGAEYPARFGGQEVILSYPTTREEVLARLEEGADAEKVLDGFIFGQGINLTIQKWFKDELNRLATGEGDSEKAARDGKSDAELIELARERVAERKFGNGKKSKAVQEAEAKADAAKGLLRETYLAVPPAVRKTLRPDLLNRGVFTEQELDEMDAA